MDLAEYQRDLIVTGHMQPGHPYISNSKFCLPLPCIKRHLHRYQ